MLFMSDSIEFIMIFKMRKAGFLGAFVNTIVLLLILLAFLQVA